MPVDEKVFERAIEYDRAAIEALLAGMYPQGHPMARALSGRGDVARGVERFVMLQAFSQLGLWRGADAAERWFIHHTLLTSRRAARHPADIAGDLLAVNAESPDAQYLAFLRALRKLPFQQREALLLYYGEK